jgi:hypothetical protein
LDDDRLCGSFAAEECSHDSIRAEGRIERAVRIEAHEPERIDVRLRPRDEDLAVGLHSHVAGAALRADHHAGRAERPVQTAVKPVAGECERRPVVTRGKAGLNDLAVRLEGKRRCSAAWTGSDTSRAEACVESTIWQVAGDSEAAVEAVATADPARPAGDDPPVGLDEERGRMRGRSDRRLDRSP